MQRITNCILINDQRALLLQKPSKGWWVAPGGKMESGESIVEAAKREYREETGLSIDDLQLVSVFTVVVREEEEIVDEWMMFSFKTTNYKGSLFTHSPEGKLEWIPLTEILQLPMAEGDKFIFQHLDNDKPLIGTVHYTKDWELLYYHFD